MFGNRLDMIRSQHIYIYIYIEQWYLIYIYIYTFIYSRDIIQSLCIYICIYIYTYGIKYKHNVGRTILNHPPVITINRWYSYHSPGMVLPTLVTINHHSSRVIAIDHFESPHYINKYKAEIYNLSLCHINIYNVGKKQCHKPPMTGNGNHTTFTI